MLVGTPNQVVPRARASVKRRMAAKPERPSCGCAAEMDQGEGNRMLSERCLAGGLGCAVPGSGHPKPQQDRITTAGCQRPATSRAPARRTYFEGKGGRTPALVGDTDREWRARIREFLRRGAPGHGGEDNEKKQNGNRRIPPRPAAPAGKSPIRGLAGPWLCFRPSQGRSRALARPNGPWRWLHPVANTGTMMATRGADPQAAARNQRERPRMTRRKHERRIQAPGAAGPGMAVDGLGRG